MEISQGLFLTVAVSLFASFVLAKLLSMLSACDAEYSAVSAAKTKAVAHELKNKGSVVSGFENERRVRFIEEAVIVNECEVEDVIVEEIEVCELPFEVEVVELGERDTREGERENVGGDEVAVEVVDESSEKAAFSEIEVEADQLLDESPKRTNFRELQIELVNDGTRVTTSEKVGILEGEGNMDNESDEVKVNEEGCGGGGGGGEEGGLLDEWEWEGIERSELEKCFGAAVAFVGSKDNADWISVLDNDAKMQLCELHKVATEGPSLMVSARAKWNAWKRLENMGPEVAMEQYITLLSKSIPGWMGNDTSEFKTTEASVEERDAIEVGDPNFISKDKQ